jgi:hypothetical protein
MKKLLLIVALIWAYSSSYAQCIKGDCVSGTGEKIYPDGSKFEGVFQNGQKLKGVYKYPNGDQYEGSFKDGNRDGLATYRYANGEQYEGFYVEDAKSYGKFSFKNGDAYTGTFARNLFNGYGSFKKHTGELIEGYWTNGKPSLPEEEGLAGMDSTRVLSLDSIGNKGSSSQKTLRPRVFAVVVGISDYQGTNLDLNYSDRDAQLFYNHLNSAMPSEVAAGKAVLLLNERATLSNINAALSDVFSNSSANDFIIFYFSGHGSVGQFVPYNHAEGLRHADLKNYFKNTEAKFRLVVADACFSGSIGTANETSVSSTQELYDARLAVIMSSKPNQTSWEMGNLEQGVFSYYLIRGMQGLADLNQDKYVTAGELFMYTKNNVSSHTSNSQIPVIYGVNLNKIPLTKVK